ncbi:RcnB family protein [Sphingomonas sp.]|jgi:Ni/Co efflux regulator RcnB|uniref:RcnB family protein n=1 Tax=Sphingomonas sp. TaxID=28214 RepID=UPI002D7E68ED|nr:RcnB family protein [Sphingomonas sp.]HEU0043143.1 RcnB family protein [Sphingomonas sp.]
MRKLITAALAATMLVPVAASAQSYNEVRRDQREVRESRRDLQDARRYGDRRDVREARQELREDRRELREDRRDYRRSDRGYNRGNYNAPRGYRYRPVTVGYRFQPSYYGRNYWVNDWNQYRLARPGYNQQWVRYGNDVVLVDIRTGRVLRVQNRFFY